MALLYPDKLKSNNPSAFAIADAAEIAGHRTVKDLASLYRIADAILSPSKNNSNNDAIGQLWYVHEQDKLYKLVDWAKRKETAGWTEFKTSGGLSLKDLYKEGGFSQISSVRPIVDGIVDDAEIAVASVTLSGPRAEGDGVVWVTAKGCFAYKLTGKSGSVTYYKDWTGDNERETSLYKTSEEDIPKQNIFQYNDIYYTINPREELVDWQTGETRIVCSLLPLELNFGTSGGGGGAVTSVNGKTGAVVLTGSNVYMSDVSEKTVGQAIEEKQNILSSGRTIKTINGESLLGAGNIEISGDGGGAVTSVNGKTGAVVLSAVDINMTNGRPVEVELGELINMQNMYNLSDGAHGNLPLTLEEAVTMISNEIQEVQRKNAGLQIMFIDKSTNKVVSYVYDGAIWNADAFATVSNWTRFGAGSSESAMEYNKPMPGVSINGSWTFYKNDGSTIAASSIVPQPNALNPVLENGYKAKFSGTYKWQSGEKTKAPTAVTSDSTFRDLPVDGANSSVYNSSIVTSNTTIRAKVSAPKTGLIVVNGNVQPATGNDTAEASVGVSFRHRRFNGLAMSNTVSEGLVEGLATTELVSGRGATVDGITTSGSQYYVYAYPSALGDLSTIIQDGATPVLGAFTKSTVQVTNAAGKQIEYNVYVSNNKGAFTNASLKFV